VQGFRLAIDSSAAQWFQDELSAPSDRLDLHVSRGSSPVEIQVFVGEREVLRHRCPDPPCHEQIRLSGRASPDSLRVMVTDPLGRSQTWRPAESAGARVAADAAGAAVRAEAAVATAAGASAAGSIEAGR
jgi:hypothetical protein